MLKRGAGDVALDSRADGPQAIRAEKPAPCSAAGPGPAEPPAIPYGRAPGGREHAREADEPLERIYFVDAGVVTLVTAFEHRVTLGVAAVGREGVVGAAALLWAATPCSAAQECWCPGPPWRWRFLGFRNALRKSLKLRAACEADTRALLVQMLQSVPCNRLHTVEQRCARWLLVCADRTESDTFDLSQQCFAETLGLPKSRVAPIARKLQHAGLIRCRGGETTVLDRGELEAVACTCSRIVRNRYERLLAQAFG